MSNSDCGEYITLMERFSESRLQVAKKKVQETQRTATSIGNVNRIANLSENLLQNS